MAILMKVKKFMVILIILILSIPSYQSREDMNDAKIPSKEDVIGFLNAINNRSKNFFYERGNLMQDLAILSSLPDGWLEDALLQFYEINGIKANKSTVSQFIENISLPKEIQQSMALLLYAYVNASNNRNKVEATILLIYVIKETMYYLTHYKLNESICGPYGKIIIGGNGNDSYDGYLFVIDFGGNDTYSSIPFIFDSHGNDKYRNMNATNITYVTVDIEGEDEYTDAFSVNASYYLFDFKGNDKYMDKICSSYEDGFFFLLDYEGNDVYEGKNETQCFSYDSISVMVDLKGDDKYQAGDYSQASSRGGISLLADFFGNDIFIAGNRSQAYAVEGSISQVKGVSMLVNFGGDDTYVAEDFSQSYSNNMGFSLLLDLLGDDFYSAKTFSQASSNAMGLSGLIDSDGKNKFKHGLFCQGYMLASVSLFMDNFEMKGNEKILERIEELNSGISNFFG